MVRPDYRPPYAAIGAGLAGVAVGTAIGAAATSGSASGYPAPGTAEWNELCARKYKSFRPSDGTYLGYDGVRHVCRLP